MISSCNKMNKRPVNLNLLTLKYPVPAIVSILHRISGVILFLLIPFILWLLASSLKPEGYAAIHQVMVHPIGKIFIWLVLASLIYHLIAGIRHLFMDAHIGDGLKSGRIGAWITLLVSFVLIILVGIWLW